MNEAPEPGTAAVRPTTAGGLLRQARQAQGLHIAALAAAIKVVPKKLELLESDQFDQLPDATFTRALAQTVCRTLKIDAAPVLALLPPPKGHRLDHLAEGLNTPFRERPGRLEPKEWALASNPVFWIAALIGVLTLAVYALPASWLPFSDSAVTRTPSAEPVAAPTPAPPMAAGPEAAVADAASAAAPAASAVPSASASEPAVSTAPDPVVVAAASGMLQFQTTAPSWVEVTDARGQSLIARVLQAGESVGLDGVLPMKVRIGNVRGTQLVFRGQPLALAPHTRDNVARFELK
jgi:cytoskeleton protein RodZ